MMSLVAELAQASAPQVVDSVEWPGVQFQVRVVSAAEAIAAGGVMQNVLGALMSLDPEADQASAARLTVMALVKMAEHKAGVARVAVVGIRKRTDADDDPPWEEVKLTGHRPAPGDHGRLWVGIIKPDDLTAIHGVAMGAAVAAVAGARPFRHEGQRGPEHDDEDAGRDGEEVRQAADGASGGSPSGLGEE